MKDYFKNIKNKEFLISIIFMMGFQALLYWSLKLLQADFHAFNHSIDSKIPFVPQLIIIYNLFYPMVFIAFYNIFNHDKDTYYKGVIASIIGFIIADIVFIVYPTVIVRPDITNLTIDPINNFVLYLTYKVDTPAINCLPSIHCLFCFQAIITSLMCRNYNNKPKIIIISILLLIATSTVLVKQHYFIDIIGALIVCGISTPLGILIYKKIKN